MITYRLICYPKNKKRNDNDLFDIDFTIQSPRPNAQGKFVREMIARGYFVAYVWVYHGEMPA